MLLLKVISPNLSSALFSFAHLFETITTFPDFLLLQDVDTWRLNEQPNERTVLIKTFQVVRLSLFAFKIEEKFF